MPLFIRYIIRFYVEFISHGLNLMNLYVIIKAYDGSSRELITLFLVDFGNKGCVLVAS